MNVLLINLMKILFIIVKVHHILMTSVFWIWAYFEMLLKLCQILRREYYIESGCNVCQPVRRFRISFNLFHKNVVHFVVFMLPQFVKITSWDNIFSSSTYQSQDLQPVSSSFVPSPSGSDLAVYSKHLVSLTCIDTFSQ